MKRLRVILLFLLLGAVVNIAVAWGIALTLTIEDASTDAADMNVAAYTNWENVTAYANGILSRYEAFGSHFYMCLHSKIEMTEEEFLILKEQFGDRPFENVKPYWGSMDTMTELVQSLPGPPEHTGVGEARIYDARGWPMLSLWCLRSHKVDEEGKLKELEPRGFIATPILPDDAWGPRGLPLYPIWPGFTVNTLFYSVILWLLFPGQRALRRFIRRKRGLCVKCAYDLRGAEHEACPECGAVPAARAAS